jgi:hypothetical protein
VGLPAGTEGGSQVAIAGAVDLLDPGADPGQRFAALVDWELPPLRHRVGGVVGRGIGGLSQDPLEVLHGAVEPGDLLAVGGELVEYGGDRVGRHAQLHGNEVSPSSSIHAGGTWSGMRGSGGRSTIIGGVGGSKICSCRTRR